MTCGSEDDIIPIDLYGNARVTGEETEGEVILKAK
jgi:hypothetical protein